MHNIRYVAAAMLMAASVAGYGSARDKVIIPPTPIQIYGGVGPVVSSESDAADLPQPASGFLEKYYPDATFQKCRRDYVKNITDVTLSNGVKIQFDKDGAVNDIRTSDNTALSPAVIAAVLPAKAVEHLVRTSSIGWISSIKNIHGRGFCVMQMNTTPPEMIFDVDGLFIFTAG